MGLFGAFKKIGGAIGGAAKKVGGVAIKAGTIAAQIGTGGLAGTIGVTLGSILFDNEQGKVDEQLALLQGASGLDLSRNVLGMAGLLRYFAQFPPPPDTAGSGSARSDYMNGAAIALNLYEPENAIGDFKFDALAVFKRYVQAWEGKNASSGSGTPSNFIDDVAPGRANRTTSFANHFRRLGEQRLTEMDARLFGRTLPGFGGFSDDTTGQRSGTQIEGTEFVDGLTKAGVSFNVKTVLIIAVLAVIVILMRKG